MGNAARFLTSALRAHTAATVFLWGVLKSMLPFPTPSVLMLAGAARAEPDAARAFWPIVWTVALPTAAGIALGGLVYYQMARARGHAIIERFHRRARLPARAARLERLSRGRRGLLIFALRALPFIPVSIGSLVAGLAQQPVSEFVAWSFAGAAIRGFILAYAGFFARQGASVLLRF